MKDDGYGVIFADESVRFECSYKRTIDVNSSFETSLTTKPLSGTGTLGYRMTINAGTLGGVTTVSVTPNHIFSQVYPRWLYIILLVYSDLQYLELSNAE